MTANSSPARSLRVLHLGGSGRMYGAERWILALLAHLPPAIESIVGVIQDTPGIAPELCAAATRGGHRAVVFEGRGKLSLAAIGGIRRFVRANAVDVLHAHGYKADLIALLAAFGTRCRTIATPHGWSARAGPRVATYEALDRLAFTLFDAVVPLSRALHAQLARRPGLASRLHLIENGVDLADIDAAPRDAELQAQRASGHRLVGYVGQLIPRKRVDTLIRAFAGLVFPDARLVLVGDGPERPALESLARNLGLQQRVQFYGFRDDRIALMKCLDLFVLPSALEGIPRCLMEAMASGTAVIASDIPGCRDLVEDGVCGSLFDPGDHARLREVLESLLTNDARRRLMADEGCRRVRREHSAEAMASRYAKVYADLVAQPASRTIVATSGARG
jgi:glycosyltransferase involved in cell wall biosynthesis